MKVQEFLEKAAQYGQAHRVLPWMIGDLLNEFVESYGNGAWQYIDEAFSLSRDTLRDYSFVADIFSPENRLDHQLTIYYFREVATLPGAVAMGLLREAVTRGWSSKDLREHAREYRKDPVRFSALDKAPALSGGAVQERKKEANTEEVRQQQEGGERSLPGQK